MVTRRQAWLVVAAAVWCMGASYPTPNFVVQAPTAQIAQQVGQYAEKYRREKAFEWLGREMPTWGQPCPLRVTITPGGAGGATNFAFDRGQILHQEMNVQGPLDRILVSVLPHEITHTVFAYHFRCPLPRWADEGGSVLSEDDIERRRHDELVRQILGGGQAFRLRVLFPMMKYPDSGSDVMTLYAEGYSVCRFVVEGIGRPQFLAFVAQGMRQGWDSAVQTFFRMNRIEDLEAAWLDWLRHGQRAGSNLVAKNAQPNGTLTARPVAQLRPPEMVPVIRAQAPPDDEGLPPVPPRGTPSRDGWAPVYPAPGRSPSAGPVQLLPPEWGPIGPSQAQQALQYPPR